MPNWCFQDLFLKKKIQSCLWDQSSSSNSQQVMGEGQNQVEKSVKLDLISSPPTNKNRQNRLQNKTDFQGSSKWMLITGNGKCTGRTRLAAGEQARTPQALTVVVVGFTELRDG